MDTDIEMKEPKRDNPLSFHYSASLKKITLPVNKQNNLNVTWMMLCCISLLSCDAHDVRQSINIIIEFSLLEKSFVCLL